jgi:hypothetical protein
MPMNAPACHADDLPMLVGNSDSSSAPASAVTAGLSGRNRVARPRRAAPPSAYRKTARRRRPARPDRAPAGRSRAKAREPRFIGSVSAKTGSTSSESRQVAMVTSIGSARQRRARGRSRPHQGVEHEEQVADPDLPAGPELAETSHEKAAMPASTMARPMIRAAPGRSPANHKQTRRSGQGSARA